MAEANTVNLRSKQSKGWRPDDKTLNGVYRQIGNHVHFRSQLRWPDALKFYLKSSSSCRRRATCCPRSPACCWCTA